MCDNGYGYGLSAVSFLTLINSSFPALTESSYLDHAASPPVPPSAIHAFANSVASTLYANPHSDSPASAATSLAIDRIRKRVLKEVFGVSDNGDVQDGWDLIFTAGTTASLKLVGEHFPWDGQKTRYRYLKESHTSLVGVRGCALARDAQVEALDLSDVDLNSGSDDDVQLTLWAYPAQCNVTGGRLGLHLSRALKRASKNTAVLVDAAAYVSTCVLDLEAVPYEEAPDFIACSFYKIYGQPSGLGALVVKRTSAPLLSRTHTHTYFGGGTIDALSVSAPFWSFPRNSHPSNSSGQIHTLHEHGTIPFFSIIGLDHAMSTHNDLFTSLSHVSRHTSHISRIARSRLSSLTHANGRPLVVLHDSLPPPPGLEMEAPGSTIAFTLQTPSPTALPIGHKHLENLATIAGFQLRTGGMCNTGVLARVSRLDDAELREMWERGRVCGDDHEFGGTDGTKPLGVARISFGASSTIEDVNKFIDFLRRYFLISEEAISLSQSLSSPSSSLSPASSTSFCPIASTSRQSTVYLQTLMCYPIKSCAGQSLHTSKFTHTGLLYDREFMLLNRATGRAMSQKRFPTMALIQPAIDEEARVMRVQAKGMQELIVPLDDTPMGETEDVKVCNDVVKSYRPFPDADKWFTQFLGVSCQLHRHPSSSSYPAKSSISSRHAHFEQEVPVPILFSNESPFLLISQSSVDAVNSWIEHDNAVDKRDSDSTPIYPSCFRANFTISTSPPPSSTDTFLPSNPILFPFREDSLNLIRIGRHTFQVLARCRRCLMICVDQETGIRMKEPFGCLARHRKNGRKRIEFGVHLMWREDLCTRDGEMRLEVGDEVVWTEDHDGLVNT